MDFSNQAQTSNSISLLLVIVLVAVAPSLILMITCFPRILIALHFLRSALGTQQMPPGQIIIGLSLFLSLFIMNKPISAAYNEAFIPYSKSEITQEAAIERAYRPFREFMLTQVQKKDIQLMGSLSGENYILQPEDNTQPSFVNPDVPPHVLIPAFMISELKAGFLIGFAIYIPFIVIDMVVASTLMAMGMMMLPPAMISLPFKILLFILVDGWDLVIKQVALSFMR